MEFQLNRGLPGMPQVPPQMPTVLLVLGAGFACFGLLLITNEWLFRYLVAGAFILFGALLAWVGLRAKRMFG